MIRFHVSLFLLDLFHTACCCCLNFRTAPPLSLKRTWLDCLSLETVLFLLSQFIFFQKQHIFSDCYLFVCIKKFEIWLRDQFSEFSSVDVCYSLYLQARIFLSVARAVKSTRRKGTHKFVFILSRGEIWCFIAINPLNNLKF